LQARKEADQMKARAQMQQVSALRGIVLDLNVLLCDPQARKEADELKARAQRAASSWLSYAVFEYTCVVVPDLSFFLCLIRKEAGEMKARAQISKCQP
jgi:regulator of protease activity HflC (stomatin/prohibitin superfamily)